MKILQAKGEVVQHDLTRLQQLVARRTAESKATVPELVLRTEVDMGAAAVFLPGTVIAELQPGYTFRDKILRPARVVVAAALPDPPAA